MNESAHQRLHQYSERTKTPYWTNLYDSKHEWIRLNSPWGLEQLKQRLYRGCTTNYRKKVIAAVWSRIRFDELNHSPKSAEDEAIRQFLKRYVND